MAEKVRLIIWDLDETFWHGTLTEGGIRIRPEVCELVKTLARRGIMSSICSKNNLDDVRVILEREGVWDYFIFPSVNWEPKGPRVATLVEAVQLRASTVMFIDDNPLNLEEVRHFVPDIQLRGHEYIPEIDADDLFVGKDDSKLMRLAQYKLLETRRKDETAAADNTGFLRSSRIQVELERDVEGNIDRVVELINRTNQLNFTKARLAEDPAEARKQALQLLNRYNIQAALLRVRDRYGDHGFCGLYVMDSEHNHLLHFAFSCRILGMGVEQWLYNLLGHPKIVIKGEVLSDPCDTSRTIDWINQATDGTEEQAEVLPIQRMLAHGGCDLSAISHYLGVHGVGVVPEFNIMRNGMALRLDHSVFLHYALDGLTDAQRQVARRLQYVDEDFSSQLLSGDSPLQCVLLSFATDCHYALYRHRETGLKVPCLLDLGPVSGDQRQHSLPPGQDHDLRAELLRLLKEEFDFCGLSTEDEFKKTLGRTFKAIDPSVSVFVLRPCDYHLNKQNGEKYPARSFLNVNRWTKEVASQFSNITLLDIPDFVQDPSEIENILHYNRKVYYRVYESILVHLKQAGHESRARTEMVAHI